MAFEFPPKFLQVPNWEPTSKILGFFRNLRKKNEKVLYYRYMLLNARLAATAATCAKSNNLHNLLLSHKAKAAAIKCLLLLNA